jgi:hypothetical protein
MRFGKRSPLGTMRFGKRSPLGTMRFGKRSPLGTMRFGKRSPLGTMRFGKRSPLGTMRFGKRERQFFPDFALWYDINPSYFNNHQQEPFAKRALLLQQLLQEKQQG